jgi:iron complex transport system substrate-binding protein
MKKANLLKLSIFMSAAVLSLTACSNGGKSTGTNAAEVNQVSEAKAEIDKAAEAAAPEASIEVEITDAHGTVVVPVKPEKVVVLDSRAFETLAAWEIELAAAPKGVMPADSPYVANEAVQDIGNHREPNLEIIAALDPELVIIGQRFAGFYEDIKTLVPNAVVIDLNFDVSETAENPGQNLVDGFISTTTSLGKIFDKNEEAARLIADFEKTIADAKAAYNGTDKMISVIVSGGNIGYSAPKSGRVWGPIADLLGWTSALEVDNSSSDHQGDDISVEAIAQSNPDWIFVLDRDASVSSTTDAVPARDVINNAPALQNTKAVREGKIVYAPNDTYTNESIQTYMEIFQIIADSLSR